MEWSKIKLIETTLAARRENIRSVYHSFCKSVLKYFQTFPENYFVPLDNLHSVSEHSFASELEALGRTLFLTFPLEVGFDPTQSQNLYQRIFQNAFKNIFENINNLCDTNTELKPKLLFQQWLNALDEGWCELNRNAKWHRGLVKHTSAAKTPAHFVRRPLYERGL